jgi:hypothetical protein
MPDTLATCEVRTAASATLDDWLAELTTFFTNTATVFTKNGSSLPAALLLDHPSGWQMLIRNNGTNLLLSIDPLGLITDLATTPTGSAEYSGERIAFVGTNVGTTIHLAEYPDAILVGFKHTTSNFWQQGFHAGKIYAPFNASDPAIYLDGFGIVSGIASIDISAANTWMMTPSTNQSNIGLTRIGQTTWSTASTRTESILGTADGGIGTRLVPVPYMFGNNSTSTLNSTVGFTKYLRKYKTSSAHRTVLPSVGLSDQAFMIFSGTTSNTQFCCLWQKSVTP